MEGIIERWDVPITIRKCIWDTIVLSPWSLVGYPRTSIIDCNQSRRHFPRSDGAGALGDDGDTSENEMVCGRAITYVHLSLEEAQDPRKSPEWSGPNVILIIRIEAGQEDRGIIWSWSSDLPVVPVGIRRTLHWQIKVILGKILSQNTYCTGNHLLLC